MRTKVTLNGRLRDHYVLLAWVLVTMTMQSCETLETRYFQDKINAATQEMVYHRYGAPHKMESLENGGSRWTYFERGSATASYSGYATGTFCKAYVLMFDKQEILREWQLQHCSN